ncbi:T9SS type A sorting domain-containing protein [Paucihalobacter sp.]|uniref:T9SS type A sorting domain-containing protein n=1 Tax=Paucihalobacter sp. TaxID=2850405 RepID=UPI002FDF5A76
MKKYAFIFIMTCNFLNAQVEEFLGAGYSSPTLVNDKLVFRLFTPEFGTELWVTDGTSEGTQLLVDINPGTGSSNVSISQSSVIDGVLYFRAAHTPHTVWRTDGTPQGTFPHINNVQIFDPNSFVKCNEFILFASKIGGNDNLWRLWRMTEFVDSELPIINTFDGKVINNVTINSIISLNETTVMFGANTNEDGWAIFGTTGATTDLIIDLYQGNNSTYNNFTQINSPKNIDGKLYFTGFQEATGFEPWTSMGSASTTNLLKDILVSPTVNSTSSPIHWTKAGNTIYFSAFDGINGRELWKTNGSSSGTLLVKDIHPGNNSNFGPFALTEFNNQLYFLQNNGTNGTQIWKSNGTEESTTMVSNTQIISSVSNPSFDKADNKLFFSGFSPLYGNELFMIDQNDEITLVADINPGINGSDPGFVIEYNGYIYFQARFGNTSNTLRTYRIALNTLDVNNNVSKSLNLKILPNPTSDYFTVVSDFMNDLSIEVYSLLGQKQNIPQMNDHRYDISQLSNGVYLVKIIDQKSNSILTKKIIKQ